jgi:hypothetical protein
MPEGVRKMKTVKKVAVPVAAPVAAPAPVPVKRRANVKKPLSDEPLARVEGPVVDISDHTVINIKVRKQEVDGRLYYLDPKKDKLYDMKFKYAGRLKEGAIVNHPDSDAES